MSDFKVHLCTEMDCFGNQIKKDLGVIITHKTKNNFMQVLNLINQ